MYLLFILQSVAFVLGNGYLDFDGSVEISLEHALEPNIFSYRGNISIASLRIGQPIIKQNSLTSNEIEKLRLLALHNKPYVLRASIVTEQDSKTVFLSTLKACMLAEAELDDRISISVTHNGKILGVVNLIASTSTCEGADVPASKLKHFSTSVYVRHAEAGPTPDTTSYIQKLEQEREAMEKGAMKDNRSFFVKYWMYIIPVVLVMMIMSNANPEGGGAPAT